MRAKLTAFIQGPYNILLFFLVFLFIFRTHSDNFLLLAFWKLILAGSLSNTIYNLPIKTQLKRLVFLLAIPPVIISWLNLWLAVHPNLFITNDLFTILFLGLCAILIVHDVITREPVTFETLRGVICAYFLVAFTFAYFYYLMEFLSPGSIPVSHIAEEFSYTHSLSDMLYYSFLTLLMFGDVDTKNIIVQTAIVLEGIFAQFYIAMLVAKIVSVYAIAIMDPKRKK